MSDVLVRAEHVSKKFCRNLKRGMLYTSSDVARELVGIRCQTEKLRRGEFWALDNVSFELKRGECLGLVGANGAGKSTLLKVLNGIIHPDTGSVRIRGRVGALIEVGAGFHPMLTGRENVYLNGAILGMTKREIDRKFDSIAEFSGLSEEILDAPVKSYSSGMFVRLGFSVAVHTEPDVLLTDEILSVGDIRFVARCRSKIQELRDNGTSIILVSHDLGLIETVCDWGMLISDGKCVSTGTSRAVTTEYRKRQIRAEAEVAPRELAQSGLEFVCGELISEGGEAVSSVVCGEDATLRLTVAAKERIDSGYISVWLLREEDQQCTGVGCLEIGRHIDQLRSGELIIRFRCQTMPARYRLGLTYSTDGVMDVHAQAMPCQFTVTPQPGNPFTGGMFAMDVWAHYAGGPAAPTIPDTHGDFCSTAITLQRSDA